MEEGQSRQLTKSGLTPSVLSFVHEIEQSQRNGDGETNKGGDCNRWDGGGTSGTFSGVRLLLNGAYDEGRYDSWFGIFRNLGR